MKDGASTYRKAYFVRHLATKPVKTASRHGGRHGRAWGSRMWWLVALIVASPAPWGQCAETATGRGKILLVRGVFTVFSLGLDDLATKLDRRGYNTEVVPASLSYLAVDGICNKCATGELSGPLVLIGHSLGGDLLPGLAERLAVDHRTVDLLVMIDATFPSNCPPKVRRCVNLYQSNFSPEWFRIFRGAPIQATNPATELVNIDIHTLPNQDEAARLNHFNIEASPWLHNIVIGEVNELFEREEGARLRSTNSQRLPVSQGDAGWTLPARRAGSFR